MKKYRVILFLLAMCFIWKPVYANDIKSIKMDIYIDKFGSAHIKEDWLIKTKEGTEVYRPHTNLGQSDITNFKAAMNNQSFKTISPWDIDASFESKAYKAGLHEVSNGYELCMGVTKYGENTYTFNYTVTNFVNHVNDADMVYWQLVPSDLSDTPEYVYVKIYSDFLYSDNLDVWGYGNYGGYAYVYDGYIEVIHEKTLNSDEYMTVLIKFPKNTFQSQAYLENDFQNYLDMANDGATTYSDKLTILDIIGMVISFVFSILPAIITIVAALIVANSSRYGTKNIKINKEARKFKNVNYFRDLPANKDIFKAYWLACQYNLVKKQTDFLGALLLKWLKNKNIENTTVLSPIVKKEQRAIKLLNNNGLNMLEMELYEMMYESSVDGVLEKNEFEKWCKKNYKKILKWFNKVIDDVTLEYTNNGLITTEKNIFGTVYVVSEALNEEAKHLAGLKKFLNEFSSIEDKESIQVVLWEEYLMYAQIMGIAKKVAKEFKELYPEVITEDVYSDIVFINTISYSGVSAATEAKARAESYSSGGGGFSSGGGGAGSFGGGSGGGVR